MSTRHPTWNDLCRLWPLEPAHDPSPPELEGEGPPGPEWPRPANRLTMLVETATKPSQWRPSKEESVFGVALGLVASAFGLALHVPGLVFDPIHTRYVRRVSSFLQPSLGR